MQVFLINEVGADSFLQRVEEFEEENCIWDSRLLIGPNLNNQSSWILKCIWDSRILIGRNLTNDSLVGEGKKGI